MRPKNHIPGNTDKCRCSYCLRIVRLREATKSKMANRPFVPMENIPMELVSEILNEWKNWFEKRSTSEGPIGAMEYLALHSGLDASYVTKLTNGRIRSHRGDGKFQTHVTFNNVEKLIMAMDWEHEWNGRLAYYYNSHVNWERYRETYREAREIGLDPHSAKKAADDFLEMAA